MPPYNKAHQINHFGGAGMDEAQVDALARQLAWGAVTRVAPDELPLFEDLNLQYQRAGDKIAENRNHDEPVGFGLELGLLTPYLLVAATAVAKFLMSSVLEAGGEELKASLKRLIGRLLDPGSSAKASLRDEPELDPSFRARIRTVADDRALAFGLTEQDAGLLADAIVGALVAPPVQR
jgi:hypothetical protein